MLLLAGCQRTSDAAFAQRVHAYLLDHPEVLREADAKLAANDKAAAAKATTIALQTYRRELEHDPRDLVINPNGKVTVVEFFDYRCGFCKLAAPEVVKLAQQNPDVRLVLKQYPIFGDVSDTAAKVALTAPARAKGLAVYASLMGDRALDDAGLDRDLGKMGLNPAQLRKAAASPDIAQDVADTRALGKDLKLSGTPTFVVGDQLIPGADMTALRAAIAAAGVRVAS
jgi:protein-disulfide isomerase